MFSLIFLNCCQLCSLIFQAICLIGFLIMAKSAETLQAVLNNCDCKLESIITQLESTALTTTNTLDESTIQDTPNPLQLMSQIKEIRSRLSSAKMRFSELQQIKNTINIELGNKLETLKGQITSIVS
ncbi:uncharacterized protein LOC128395704 [Panonychus citri]|uniref:uncharacterized protein LOC128395704 n=1 Tax=Panonychus citri TaxID=50023 RepID=UPI002307B3A0|nr:uncharacterized protein LOC128395704 [Panonychus citri]